MLSVMSRILLMIMAVFLPLLASAADSTEVKPLRPVTSAYMVDA